MEHSVFENKPRIALVYDRVNTRFGGAEYVLQVLHSIFPEAPLYTSVYSENRATWAKGWDIRTSFIQKLPLAQNHHRAYLPLMPTAFESFDFSDYDIVISISSAEAKGIITSASTLHINYLLTPTRYLWSHHLEYQSGPFSHVKSLFFSRLRSWDYIASQRPDYVIPISHLVKQRCEKYYRRKTEEVIYPPFNKLQKSNSKFQHNQNSININLNNYYLMVSRLVDYKKVDLAIEVCSTLKKPLVIVGDGPEKDRLSRLISDKNADDYIQIISDVHYNQLIEIYRKAKGLLLLAEEDFGLVALESQSIGVPVLVYKRSGAAEVVVDTKTGIHISEQTVEAIEKAMYSFESRQFNQALIEHHAEQYNTEQFINIFSAKIDELWKAHQFLN